MSAGTRCFPYQWVKLQNYESRTLFFITTLQYHCILGLAEIKPVCIDKKIKPVQYMVQTETKMASLPAGTLQDWLD